MPAAGPAGDAGDGKYAVLQRIVTAQDAYIKELEGGSPQQSDAGVNHWRQQADGLAQQLAVSEEENRLLIADNRELRQRLDGQSADLLSGRHRDNDERGDEAQAQLEREREWLKERDALIQLVEQAQTLNTEMEATLSRERAEADARIQREAAALAEQQLMSAEGAAVAPSLQHVQQELVRARRVAQEQDAATAALHSAMSTEVQRLQALLAEQQQAAAAKDAEVQSQLEFSRRQVEHCEVALAEARHQHEQELARVDADAERRVAAAEAAGRAHREAVARLEKDASADRERQFERQAEFESRLQAALQQREESETRLIAEKALLLKQVRDVDALRDGHDEKRLQVIARAAEGQERMLDAWEQWEGSLAEQVEAAQAAALESQRLAAEKEELLARDGADMMDSHQRLAVAEEERVARHRAENASLQAELAQLRADYDSREKMFVAERRAHEAETAGLRAAAQNAQAHKGDALVAVEAERDALRRDVARLRKATSDREGRINAMAAEHSAAVRRLEDALAETTHQLQELSAIGQATEMEFQQELGSLRQRVERTEALASQAQVSAAKEIERLQTQVQSQEELSHSQQAKVRQAQRELEAAAESRVAGLEDEARVLRQQLAATSEERQRLSQEASTLQRQKDELLQLYERAQESFRERQRVTLSELQTAHDAQTTYEQQLSDLRQASAFDQRELALPQTWRQQLDAGSQSRAELQRENQLLREAAVQAQATYNRVSSGTAAELTMLRGAQTQYRQELDRVNALWAEERGRLCESLRATEESLAVAEGSAHAETANLRALCRELQTMSLRIAAREEEREQAFLHERAAAEEACAAALSAAEADRAASQLAVSELTHEINRLRSDSIDARLQLAQEEHEAERQQWLAEEDRLRGDAERALERASLLSEQLGSVKGAAEEEATAAAQELKQLRGELQHVRRLANEDQLRAARDKQGLLAQMEAVRRATDVRVKELTSHFELRAADAEAAAQEASDSSRAERAAAREAVLAAQRASKEAAGLHAAEVAQLHEALGVLGQLEAERERHVAEERTVTRRLLDQLQQHHERERSIHHESTQALEREVEKLKAAQEQQRAEPAAAASSPERRPSAMTSAAVADASRQVAGLVSTIRDQEGRQVQQLAAENQALRDRLAQLRREMEEREQASFQEFQRIRGTFERFQQLAHQKDALRSSAAVPPSPAGSSTSSVTSAAAIEALPPMRRSSMTRGRGRGARGRGRGPPSAP